MHFLEIRKNLFKLLLILADVLLFLMVAASYLALKQSIAAYGKTIKTTIAVVYCFRIM